MGEDILASSESSSFGFNQIFITAWIVLPTAYLDEGWFQN